MVEDIYNYSQNDSLTKRYVHKYVIRMYQLIRSKMEIMTTKEILNLMNWLREHEILIDSMNMIRNVIGKKDGVIWR